MIPTLASVLTSFNTQPPEGGWRELPQQGSVPRGFNTQPPEGGWRNPLHHTDLWAMFQHTAARRRLESLVAHTPKACDVSTHSRPKAAGYGIQRPIDQALVSTHSRPKAAGRRRKSMRRRRRRFNTQPPEGGWRRV